MSEQPIIEVSNLSKVYRLYDSHRDVIKETFHPFRKKYHKKYYALKDISFEVKKGEVLGIIGKNGSGKSTLLKILASVVSPTSGNYVCKGRMSSLLELGGGFNKDLTGIENIYFFGAIQGFSKKEISNWLPEILEFAEIGDYAYQPVKTYSSGMYVRLTFSVAIHINPEILLTDEALAVGDMRFQQKCFRRIRNFKDSGKTIVIVSHTMSKIKEYCTHAIWLDQGKIKMEGDPHSITDAYLAYMNSNDETKKTLFNDLSSASIIESEKMNELTSSIPDVKWYDTKHLNDFGTKKAIIRKVGFANLSTGNDPNSLKGGEKIRLLFVVENEIKLNNPGFHVILNGRIGAPIFKINNYANKQQLKLEPKKPNLVVLDFTFPKIGNGQYAFSVVAIDRVNSADEYLHWIHDVLIIKVDNKHSNYKQGSVIALEDYTFQGQEIALKTN